MITKCGCLQSRFDVVGVLSQTGECLRPDGHVGPHLIRHNGHREGEYVIWEDKSCPWGECADCDSDDTQDNCLVYGVVSDEEAKRFVEERNYRG